MDWWMVRIESKIEYSRPFSSSYFCTSVGPLATFVLWTSDYHLYWGSSSIRICVLQSVFPSTHRSYLCTSVGLLSTCVLWSPDYPCTEVLPVFLPLYFSTSSHRSYLCTSVDLLSTFVLLTTLVLRFFQYSYLCTSVRPPIVPTFVLQ